MDRKALLLIVTTFAVATPACVGEGRFMVKGVIASPTELSRDDCLLEVYRKRGKEPVEVRRIPAIFERSFTISGLTVPRKYRFIVRCDGHVFKSRSYRVMGVQQFLDPIDLGSIKLVKSSDEGSE